MAESTTAVVAALVGNGALAVLKGISAAFTGSAAMLAETFHSLADTGNEVMLLIGLHASERPADPRHPFGHGMEVYFWAFVVSMLLFTLGGAWAIWEAVRHALHPVDKQASWWSYAVLGGGAVFESASLAVAVRGLGQAKGDRTLSEYWRESRDPTLITVMLEDTAALVSLAIAAAGIWIASQTGNGLWDAAASGLIGVLLLAVAVVLAVENHSLLLGEAAPARVQATIRGVVARVPGVRAIRELHTMHLGPERLMVVLSIEFAEDLRAPGVAEAAAEAQRAVRDALAGTSDARLIAIEPALPVRASAPESLTG
jgi:cation diffusion facilitator family transporter